MGFCFQFFWQHVRRSNVIMIYLVTFIIKQEQKRKGILWLTNENKFDEWIRAQLFFNTSTHKILPFYLGARHPTFFSFYLIRIGRLSE